MHFIAISGSLRKASYNTMLMNAAAQRLPDGVTMQRETLHGVPLYNGDDEEETGIPPRVVELKDAIAAADGLIIFTPEYNNTVPGVLKNAMDWMTRPPNDAARVWAQKPIAFAGATPGVYATERAQLHWLPHVRAIGALPFFSKKVQVARASKVFDENGNLTDDTTAKQLTALLEGFAEFCRG